jgi:membrane associated rhomboid family serine protease
MIPIRDTIRSTNRPVANAFIIAVNVLVFLWQMNLGHKLDSFIYTYGLVPARYSVPRLASYFTSDQQAFSFLSFMFVHGGFWHLFGNMWSLYIFGDNVEDRLGPLRYLLFYVLCGLTSGLSHLFINWHSNVPTIGASGAIAGVMGAYLLLYPKARILTLIPIFFLPYFLEIPAYFFLGFWFFIQFVSAAGSPSHGGGIAWWAHIGGFLCGMVFLKLFLSLPQLGISTRLKRLVTTEKTHRLHVIKTTDSQEDSNLRGSIIITPLEARMGARKIVSVGSRAKTRLIRIVLPPGIRQGTLLRLKGMGKKIDSRTSGDLYLKVIIGQDETP